MEDKSVTVSATSSPQSSKSIASMNCDKSVTETVTGEKSTMKVYLTNGTFQIVKYGDATDIRGIVQLLTSRLSSDSSQRRFEGCYGIRLINTLNRDEVYWLHHDLGVMQVMHEHRNKSEDWRYELRIRYMPSSLSDLLSKDCVTFHYLYDQLKNDYLALTANVELETAILLCCLEIRRYFKDISHFALDKKSNFEYLDKEIGLHKLLPSTVLSSVKRKVLRKAIQSQFRKVSTLDEIDCMLRFIDLLQSLLKFKEESFKCALG
ncbi:focal adhesion kinase 1-like isoform X2, partial [Leptotrombidium deliense]